MQKKVLILPFVSILLTACFDTSPPPSWSASKSDTSLAKHTEIFTERVEKVAEGLYIAIGFGLANSILIEGDDGVIIVDTMEVWKPAKVRGL